MNILGSWKQIYFYNPGPLPCCRRISFALPIISFLLLLSTTVHNCFPFFVCRHNLISPFVSCPPSRYRTPVNPSISSSAPSWRSRSIQHQQEVNYIKWTSIVQCINQPFNELYKKEKNSTRRDTETNIYRGQYSCCYCDSTLSRQHHHGAFINPFPIAINTERRTDPNRVCVFVSGQSISQIISL